MRLLLGLSLVFGLFVGNAHAEQIIVGNFSEAEAIISILADPSCVIQQPNQFGWYYQPAAAPCKIVICEDVAHQLALDKSGQVQILIGCDENNQ